MNNYDSLSDYHIDAWLTSDKINYVKTILLHSFDILVASDLLDKYLAAWSEIEILKEIILCRKIKDQLLADDIDLESIITNFAEFPPYRKSIIYAWSSYHWSNRLESCYLAKKSSLEKISFDLISVETNELAFEIYHRLKASESTFSELYIQFDKTTQPNKNNGMYKLQPISNFPETMHPYLRRLESGDLLRPFVNGNYYSVLRMENLFSPTFDKDTKDLLLYEEFLEWQQELLVQLKDHLLT